MRVQKRKLLCCTLTLLMIPGGLFGCKSEDEISQYREQESRSTQEIVIKQELEKDVRTIKMTGNGKVEAKPDIATVQLSVQVSADTSEEAQQFNNELMDEVLKAMRSKGVTNENISTQEVTILPNQDSTKTPPEIKGYTATNTIKIQIKNVQRTSEIIDAASQAGATVVFPLEYQLNEESEQNAYREALKKAINDANTKAELTAEEAGVDLEGPGVIIEEFDAAANPTKLLVYEGYEPVVSSEEEDGTHAPLQAGELVVAAKVTVEYRIKWPSTKPKADAVQP
ncbi:SIMPL domain-containing protein [Christensenellaceae bacterium OttesenSCG-928-M15]|nr:SIMPL domain-containing protein [Christensenellaceae bacterium OttesenSCG-928-M15]